MRRSVVFTMELDHCRPVDASQALMNSMLKDIEAAVVVFKRHPGLWQEWKEERDKAPATARSEEALADASFGVKLRLG